MEPLGPALKVYSRVQIFHPVALVLVLSNMEVSVYNPSSGSGGIAVVASVSAVTKSRSFPAVLSSNGSGL